MPGVGSTPTTRDRFELQQPGRNLNQWGLFLNNDVIQLIDDSLDGQVAISTTGGVTTLTVNNYSTDQSRQRTLTITGTLASQTSIVLPSGYAHWYYIINNTSGAFPLYVAVSGGTSALATQGVVTRVITDGTNTSSMEPTLDKVLAPVASVNFSGQKITNLLAGTAATDGASLSNRLDQFAAPTASVNFSGQKLINLGNATASGDGMNLSTTLAQPLNTFSAPVATISMGTQLVTNVLDANTSLGAVNLSQLSAAVAAISGGSGGTGAVRVTITDTTAAFLNSKVATLGPIGTSVLNPGGNEILQFRVAPNVTSKTANYSVSATGDLGSVIEIISGSPTITLPAASISGFNVTIINSGAGIPAVVANGGSLIGSQTSILLQQYQSVHPVVNASSSAYDLLSDAGLTRFGYTAPAGNYTLSAVDNNKLVDMVSTGAPTASFTTGAALPIGWQAWVRSPSSTTNLSSAQGIDNVSTRPLYAGYTTLIGWDGTQFRQVIAAASTVQFNYWGDGSDGALTVSGATNLPNTTDGDMVVKNYTALTINASGTLTTTTRCRGLLVYVAGDCTINGTLTMTARGCSADPTGTSSGDAHAVNASGITFWRRTATGTAGFVANGTYGCGTSAVAAEINQANTPGSATLYTITRAGATGGAGGSAGGGSGTAGTVGSAGATGGSGGGGGAAGGAGGGAAVGSGGTGATGTCFSGGTGGGAGGSSAGAGTNGTNGGANGAAGGNAGANDATGGSRASSGGSGNPAGTNTTSGAASVGAGGTGTGGLLILLVRGNLTIGAAGIISADGVQAGSPTGGTANDVGGGGSGGGNVLVLYGGALSNAGTVRAIGGIATAAGGADPKNGGAGGAGSAQGPTKILV